MQAGSVLCATDIKEADVSTDEQHRYGVCHRCGWRGEVAKIRRRDRRSLQSEIAYSRLCPECISDLYRLSDGQSPLSLAGDAGAADSAATDRHTEQDSTNQQSGG
jgi:Zn finger protein HypA/HybF involved in hydrogenase expression